MTMRSLACLLAVALGHSAAPVDPPTVPAEAESLTAGLRPFEHIADWAERAGAVALGSRETGEDPALLADLGLDPAALGPERLASELRARALDLAWRVIEHPDCDPVLRLRAEERIRALVSTVPPNRDPALASVFRALVVIARSSEWSDPGRSGGPASRATFGDDEIARLRREIAETSAGVFELSRGVLRLDVTIRVVEGAPFDRFEHNASREYDRRGVLPDLAAEATRRRFLDPEAAVREGFHGAFLCVKYEGTVSGPPIPSPSDGHGGAMRVTLKGGDGSPSVRHLGYGTLHYRSRAASWFGRTGFLHEWYHGLHDLAELAAPSAARLPDNHSVLVTGPRTSGLASQRGGGDRLVSDDEPDFYRIVLGEMFPPRLLRAVAPER